VQAAPALSQAAKLSGSGDLEATGAPSAGSGRHM